MILMALKMPPGASALPDLAEPAGPEAVEERVAGDGFGMGFDADSHVRSAPASVGVGRSFRWKPSTEFRPRLKKCGSRNWGNTGDFAPGGVTGRDAEPIRSCSNP